ncbi:MAG: helix-turn-helix transcriptional regulator [Burkholderiaceae bacterium]|nr:helix-turn-helix transcriptional regulator [Burkholderiaceae bacterium]
MRLREERERLGKSQSDFAALAVQLGVRGATRQSLSMYEKGERPPDAGYLAAIAQAGADVRYIVTGARDYEPPPVLTPQEQLLLDEFRRASPAMRRNALGALMGVLHAADAEKIYGNVGQVVHGDVHGVKIDQRSSSAAKPPRKR